MAEDILDKRELEQDQSEGARNTTTKAPEMHCPFGCGLADCDENGYCHHLVGFTNDGKYYEPVMVTYRKHFKTGEWYKPGTVQVNGGRRCRPIIMKKHPQDENADILVNPTSLQLADGITRTAYRWVSSRVYRPTMKKPEPTEDMAELDRLTAPQHAGV